MNDMEKNALERRIDELCAENGLLKARNAKVLWLVVDMCTCFHIGAEREGVSKQWCYELFDTYAGKLRELGIEVPE